MICPMESRMTRIALATAALALTLAPVAFASTTVTPEPGTIALLGIGFAGFALLARRRRR